MKTNLTRRTALGLALAAPAILRTSRAYAANELRVMAWQGYADDDWVKEFEQETGADVNVVFIGTDDEIWAKINANK